MPLPILAAVVQDYFPSQYSVRVGIAILALVVLRAYAQGRKTNRERDLHGRVILITGSFTSFGLTLLEALAKRGAHIIALSPDPIEEPHIELVIEALRETNGNKQIFAEHCDLHSVESVKAFCTKFLVGQETRLDAIIFTHEYEHLGPCFASQSERQKCESRRSSASDATFLITTLLLPTLLVAPPERDIRIINVINPFYAAAVPLFPKAPNRRGSQLVLEGFRALRSAILSRHLQRVFDSLPSAPAPDPETSSASMASNKEQKSNIVSVSVSPGFSRADTIAPLLRANRASTGFSYVGFVIYILLQPILRILTKSSTSSIQSVLHALFLPTPFKRPTVQTEGAQSPLSDTLPEELLKPGALYSDCSVVRLNIRKHVKDEAKGDAKREATGVDDGEFGGEELGTMVWESYEESLKAAGATIVPPSEKETPDSERLKGD